MPIKTCILDIGDTPQSVWDTGDAVGFTLAVADPLLPVLPRRWISFPSTEERLGFELVDPTTVTFSLLNEGVVTTHVYGVSSDLLQDATGQYSIVLPVDESGVYTYRWAVSGDYQGAEEANFTVQVSPFNTPVNTVAPFVSGTGTVGQTLSCTEGEWSRDPTDFAYQWLRDGDEIAGEQDDSYLLVFADYLHDISCRVTATNESGSSSADSNAITIDVPVPINTVLPVVSVDNAVPGATATVSTGTWTASSTPTYTYQWTRCDAAGANGVDIGGATSSSFAVTETDIDSTLRCTITATDIYGFAEATTDPTDVVHFPSQSIFIPVLAPASAQTNWSTLTQGSTFFFGGETISSGGQNATISFDFYAEAGAYSLDLYHNATNASGIYTLAIDGVTLDAQIDGYNSSTVSLRATLANLTIVTSEVHTIQLTMASKNPASSSYIGAIEGLVMSREA